MDIDSFDAIYTYAASVAIAVMAAAVGWLWKHPRKDDPCDNDDDSFPD
jgi:hypothetical protein